MSWAFIGSLFFRRGREAFSIMSFIFRTLPKETRHVPGFILRQSGEVNLASASFLACGTHSFSSSREYWWFNIGPFRFLFSGLLWVKLDSNKPSLQIIVQQQNKTKTRMREKLQNCRETVTALGRYWATCTHNLFGRKGTSFFNSTTSNNKHYIVSNLGEHFHNIKYISKKSAIQQLPFFFKIKIE